LCAIALVFTLSRAAVFGVRMSFLPFRAYIHGSGVLYQLGNYQSAEAISLGLSETEMTLASDSEEVLKKRSDASFRKEERVKEGTKAKLEYEAEERAVLKKTARLRALRLAKEAAEKTAKLATEPGKPPRQKRAIRPIP
jgi:hypothetical protein